MSESATTRKCKNCGEWYDARSPSCYLCGTEDREENYALQKAVETTRLNSALASQAANVRGEARAEQLFRNARNNGTAYDRPLTGINGYGTLVGRIKNALEESGL